MPEVLLEEMYFRQCPQTYDYRPLINMWSAKKQYCPKARGWKTCVAQKRTHSHLQTTDLSIPDQKCRRFEQKLIWASQLNVSNATDGLTRAAPQARRYRLCPEQGRHLNGGLPDWTREKQKKTKAWTKTVPPPNFQKVVANASKKPVGVAIVRPTMESGHGRGEKLSSNSTSSCTPGLQQRKGLKNNIAA